MELIGLPVSWDILIQALHAIELHQLANEVHIMTLCTTMAAGWNVIVRFFFVQVRMHNFLKSPPIFELIFYQIFLLCTLTFLLCYYLVIILGVQL